MIQRTLRGDFQADHGPQHADRDVVRQTECKQDRQGNGYLDNLGQTAKHDVK